MSVQILESERQRGLADFESLSRAEIEVFNIEISLAQSLHQAFMRYEMMIGAALQSGKSELGIQARKDREAFAGRLGGDTENWPFDPETCVRFMHEICGLPVDQANAWVRKIEAQEWRYGLYNIDETKVQTHIGNRREAP